MAALGMTGLFLGTSALAQQEPGHPGEVSPTSAAPPPYQPVAPPPTAQRRDGFYGRFELGFSYLWVGGEGPSGSASSHGLGTGVESSLGAAIAPGFALAGTLRLSTTSSTFHGGPFEHASIAVGGQTKPASDQATTGAAELGLLVDWFPDPGTGWHVGASAGLGGVTLTNQADDSHWSGLAPAGSVSGGYNWPSGGKWSLGLTLVAATAARRDLRNSDHGDTGYRMMPVAVGLQVGLLYF